MVVYLQAPHCGRNSDRQCVIKLRPELGPKSPARLTTHKKSINATKTHHQTSSTLQVLNFSLRTNIPQTMYNQFPLIIEVLLQKIMLLPKYLPK